MKPVKTEIFSWGVKFIFADGSFCKKHYDGKEYWYDNLRDYHREDDLPAVILSEMEKEWFIHGVRHRDNDKPARIMSGGLAEWYTNGKLVKRELFV